MILVVSLIAIILLIAKMELQIEVVHYYNLLKRGYYLRWYYDGAYHEYCLYDEM